MNQSDDDLVDFAKRLEHEFGNMTRLLINKRKSYGTSALTRFDPIGIVIRASDKIDRLTTMCQTGADCNADGDSMEDAWRDLIGYGALGLLHHLDGRHKP